MGNREIKFCAWNKYLKRMFTVYCIDWRHGLIYCQGEDGNTHTFGFIDTELREYTGLKDKNGIEIYEGDIAKSPHGGIGIVEFHNSWGAFYYKTVIGKNEDGKLVRMHSSVPFWNDALKFEVIGNIYENSDLLGRDTALKKGDEIMGNYREILRGFKYPESVLEKMSDEECEGEYEIVTSQNHSN